MVDIRPNALPAAILPLRTGDAVIVDQGADGVRQTNPISFTDSVAPVATQSEAQAGTDNAKRMTPLRTKQSIASEVGVTLASSSQGTKADSAVQSVNGKTGNSVTLAKGDVGLGNVDNTSDANKPVSTATQVSLDLKANSSVTISSGAGLTGGGSLAANRTISLNSTSIASLAKADSSVQTVNGVAPTGGNVSVSAEEVRLQDSRSSAILETFAGSVNFVQTAGYSSAGDGGAALYKRAISEPSHEGKFQSADGAWWEIDMRNGVNVLQFGAKGDGAADDTVAIQNAYDAINSVGGILRLPSGKYNITGTLNFTQTEGSWTGNRRVTVLGDGSGLTTISCVSPSVIGHMIKWGTQNTGTAYGNGWQKIGGFFLQGNLKAQQGILIQAKSWFEANDIKINGCTQINFNFDSTVSWSGRSLRSYGSVTGMYFQKSSDPLAYSIPNNITLIDCTIGNSTQWGIFAVNTGPINFIGGSMEANGEHGRNDSGALKLIRQNDGVGIEAVAANLYGTYFEHNKGGADIYISQNTTSYPVIVNAQGCNFNRVSSDGYVTNNIKLEVLTLQTSILNLEGCGFNYGGDYSPNAARRTIAATGNQSYATINIGKGCIFRSSVDRPDIEYPGDIPEAYAFASLRCQSSGTIIRQQNIQTVSKTGTGVYQVTLRKAASSANPQAFGSVIGGAGFVWVSGETSNPITVTTTNSSGVAADQAFSLVIFDA